MVKSWLREEPKNETKTLTQDLHCYTRILDQLSLDDDGCLLMYKYYPLDLVLGKRKKIILPPSLYYKVIAAAHTHKLAGHFSLNSTLSCLISKFFFPSTYTECRNYIQQCEECLVEVRGFNDKRFKQTTVESGYLNHCCHVNLFGPIQNGSSGYK